MYRIEDIDRNFQIPGKTPPDAVFRDALEPPFRVYGVFPENGRFRRMPEEAARAVSTAVLHLHANTAGGRLRFATDSPYVAVAARMERIGKMSHFALTGSAGFDVYVTEEGRQRYAGTLRPPFTVADGFADTVELGPRRRREVTIHFPLYSDVLSLAVGLAEGASLSPAAPYRAGAPMVFYGSSITQGGCASRPGSAYPNILSRRLGVDHVNLGFSGSARAEDAMAAYIAGLEMSLFVYDYDHNAPDPAHLAETHERMFRTVREKHPDIPIVVLSRPKVRLDAEEEGRLRIIRETCRHAAADGDRNVYLIAGSELMQYAGDEGTVDGTHPTDYGFASMARTLEDLLRTLL